jgi:hypothetical protein
VVPRRKSFVPDVDEGFFVLHEELEKEAQMKKIIRIDYIHRTASLVFWKEGSLLPRLPAYKCKSTECLETKL